MVKKIFLRGIIVLIGGLLLVAVLFFALHRNSNISAKANAKIIIKSGLVKLKKIIYREATLHNPAGDMVPDQIDDIITGRIKENL